MYIPRSLVISRGSEDERVAESEVKRLSPPLVIVGEPGLGKTMLTERLAADMGTLRVTAGFFSRCRDLTKLTPPDGKPIIIDGLDEISPASGSIVDEVLGKLSELGYPPFIISCRAADWEGSLASHKILEDYKSRPDILHLLPFTHQDAIGFLADQIDKNQAKTFLDALENSGLIDLTGNPLTLMLLAELASDTRDLPSSRAELFERACPKLISERNLIHQRSPTAKVSKDVVLATAGEIFAHLLLSGNVGVTSGSRDDLPAGYISEAELTDLSSGVVSAVVKTRLFRSDAEDVNVPVHRLIAEFLAAQWLAKRLAAGLSERRLFQVLAGGKRVPTALRGVHAWLAHFYPPVASRCIASDPFGVLRYGDIDKLGTEQARELLKALASLAEEDPYFRSEDWAPRAVRGLAREELKEEIRQIVTDEKAPFHFSTLLLEALKGSGLASSLSPDLLNLLRSDRASYIVRHRALETLLVITSTISWPVEIRSLAESNDEDSQRLAIEAILKLAGQDLDPKLIADSIVALHRLNSPRPESFIGADIELPRELRSSQLVQVLDHLAEKFAAFDFSESRKPHHSFQRFMQLAIAQVVSGPESYSPERIWQWLKYLNNSDGFEDRGICEYFTERPNLRRAIQRMAFAEPSSGDTPLMAIAFDLPEISSGLTLTAEDAAFFLSEIAEKKSLSKFDIDLWCDLATSYGRQQELAQALHEAASLGVSSHPALAEFWNQVLPKPVERPWEARRQQESERQKLEQANKFAEDRQKFGALRDQITTGAALGALLQLSPAYMGMKKNLSDDLKPEERLSEWVGDELANAARDGFVAALYRHDLPTANELARLNAADLNFRVKGRLLLCGLREMKARGLALANVPFSTLRSSLATWWHRPDWSDRTFGGELKQDLECLVFEKDAGRRSFLADVVEPYIEVATEEASKVAYYMIDRIRESKNEAASLATKWLLDFPNALPRIQAKLLKLVVDIGAREEIEALFNSRLATLDILTEEARKVWAATGLAAGADGWLDIAKSIADSDPDFIWILRSALRKHGTRASLNSTRLSSLEFAVREFAVKWPPAEFESGWGDQNPWNASEFIHECIQAIGSDKSESASEVLARLVESTATSKYENQIRHVRAKQLQARLDSEYMASSFQDIKQMLAGGPPSNIDDLKALVLDRLATIQKYTRDGDTRVWEKYWSAGRPLDEDKCRNRLLDDLRPRMPEISLNPESLMPARKRVDILAQHGGEGFPIEIKGAMAQGDLARGFDPAGTQIHEGLARPRSRHLFGLLVRQSRQEKSPRSSKGPTCARHSRRAARDARRRPYRKRTIKD